MVHVIHAADGMIPSDMATGESEGIEEERRLFYVGLTRARDALYVYFPLRSYRRPRGLADDHAYSQLTRFLPEQVRGLFDQRSSELSAMPSALAGTPSGPDGYLRDLWD